LLRDDGSASGIPGWRLVNSHRRVGAACLWLLIVHLQGYQEPSYSKFSGGQC